MATTTTTSLTVKTAEEVRADFLRTYQYAAAKRGKTVDITAGSEAYNLGTALGYEIEVLGAAEQADADSEMPDTAQGDGIDRWLGILGCPPRRAAAGSAGVVIFDTTQAGYVRAGLTLTDALSQTHVVTVAGIYKNGDPIPVACRATGTSTDRPAGELLRWGNPPPYSAQTAAVGPLGLTGGSEAEDDATAQARYMRRFRVPPGNGNTTDLIEAAEASSPLVQAAFAYPALSGPATQCVAVAGWASTTNTSRQVDPTVMTAVVAPGTIGQLVEHAATSVLSVVDAPCDVAIALSLPSSPAASPPGPGGGWLDGTPWPVPPAGSSAATITGISDTQGYVLASAPPVVGASRVAYLRRADWTVYHATVIASVPSGTNTYTVTFDTALPDISTDWGAFLSPDAANIDAYYAAVLAAFRMMGPGEMTANPAVLARAYRHPMASGTLYPAAVDTNVLRAVEDVGTEVGATAYRYRSFTSPPVPANVSTGPSIAVPHYVGFYPVAP